MIHAEIECCAGIDVGKQRLAICVMIGPLHEEPRVEMRTCGTTVAELERLRDWLQQEGVTHVVMESTGNYWRPVFNVLEGAVQVYLANAQEVKNRKGHKTDRKDGWWLAHLLRHAMIRPSFVPPRPQRELRDFTRRRRKLIDTATSERNRIDKILQDANVKLSDAISDIFGVSGQLMLEALLAGKATPEQIAQLAKKRARQRIPEIIASLQGHRMNDHHRRMIRFSLEHMRFLEQQILELDEAIASRIEEAGYTRQLQLLESVPGFRPTTAANVLAEIGPEMKQFESEKALSSWAGVCPGNNRSAGRDLGSRTTGGNPWVRSALIECSWGVANKNNCFLKDKFRRVTSKRQNKKVAIVAVAHTLLILAYRTLTSGEPYKESDISPVLESTRKERIVRHHIRRLGRLGVRVQAAPIPEPVRRARKETLTD